MPHKLFENWSWRLPLPAPYDDSSIQLSRTDVYSKYCTASAKKSTLHGPTLRALIHYAELVEASEDGLPLTGLGAVGAQHDNFLVAEYPGNGGAVAVVFIRDNGKFIACKVSAGAYSAYRIAEREQSGSAMLFCLMPRFLEDEEFADAFQELRDQKKAGLPDLDAASATACLLCDNIYRRVSNAASLAAGGVAAVLNPTGNVNVLNQIAIDNNTYSPTDVLYGEFQVFQVGFAPAAAGPVTTHGSFTGQYPLSSRVLSPLEQDLAVRLPAWYVIPPQAPIICKLLQQTTGSTSPVRNILFRGEAGVGKSELVKALSAATGLPYVFQGFSPMAEESDLFCSFLPETGACGTRNIPSFEDIRMDPASAYCELTGEYDEAVTPDDVIRQIASLSAPKDGKPGFICVESPLIQAIRYGWIIELQEVNVIANPGVLARLNSLMDGCQSVVLPTGEALHRHPDTVICITVNPGYEGTRPINQAVISRMDLVYDLDRMDLDTAVKRSMAVTGCTDKPLVTKMAEVVIATAKHCKDTMISDGSW